MLPEKKLTKWRQKEAQLPSTPFCVSKLLICYFLQRGENPKVLKVECAADGEGSRKQIPSRDVNVGFSALFIVSLLPHQQAISLNE